MSAAFLVNLMRIALHTTGAERALAVDSQMGVVDTINLDQTDINSEKFTGFESIREALAKGAPIITNNAVMDASRAPVTNTSFSNLRVVVVIPVEGLGAIYLDQPIRRGMIAKEIVNRLMVLGQQAVHDGQIAASESDLQALYGRIH
jgi:hypothetical protein